MLRSLETRVIQKGYDQKTCWVHARCGWVNPNGPEPILVVTMQPCQMSDSIDAWDLFLGLHSMYSRDKGETWSELAPQSGLAAWDEPGGTYVVISDFTPQWHQASGKLLGFGHTCRYVNGKLMPAPRPRETVWSVYDERLHEWQPAQLLDMQDHETYFCAGAGSIQWLEESDGTLLVPIYYKSRAESITPHYSIHPSTKVQVLRCRFDGERVEIMEKGNEMKIPLYRGLGEPSLIKAGEQYWITLRNGEHAYHSVSEDGLHFSDPVAWTFDDGGDLGSYDTQQHWFTIGSRLYLVYTRRGLDNDDINRNRAPLLMAEIDQDRRCVIRETERVVVPHRGAMLANFGVSQKDSAEAWICVSEWMENAFPSNERVWNALKARYPDVDLEVLATMPGRCGICELGGSDNSVFLVRVT